jgi:glycerophosphoryl diester phosphodiesterase
VSGPRVIAHRGASTEFPEHTRAAYRRALEVGADGLECDVRLSADLVPVLLHDARLDATTSGSGPLGARTAAELDLVHLRARRVRRRRRAQAVDEAAEADPSATDPFTEIGVLRLAELLAMAAAAGRPVELAVETKHPSRAGRQLEAAVLAALAAEPTVRGGVRIMSFSSGALRRLRLLDPTVPTVLLLADAPVGRWVGPLPPEADIAGPSVRQLRRDAGLVARVHDAGAQVHVWTVDTDTDIDHCVALGVDVLITNRPAHVLGRLGR